MWLWQLATIKINTFSKKKQFFLEITRNSNANVGVTRCDASHSVY